MLSKTELTKQCARVAEIEEDCRRLANVETDENFVVEKEIRQLLQRIEVKALFYRLERSDGIGEVPTHQELISSLLRCWKSPAESQQAPVVLADARWAQVRTDSAALRRCKARHRQCKKGGLGLQATCSKRYSSQQLGHCRDESGVRGP